MLLSFLSRTERWKMLTRRQAFRIWLLEHRVLSYAFATVSIFVLAVTIGLQTPAVSPTSSAIVEDNAHLEAMTLRGEEASVSSDDTDVAVTNLSMWDEVLSFVSVFVSRFE